MADACLDAIGVETTAAAVAGLYGDFLDGWLVDTSDGALATRSVGRPVVRARPLFMSDVEATAAIASAALDLARELAGELAPDRTPA
jgi:LPPG:FO 2-phospho-L-lactate transferase